MEKRPNTEGTAIVNEIVPGSQAEEAGLKRGDILCFGGSSGQAEMHYDIFLEMARSDERPLGKLILGRLDTSTTVVYHGNYWFTSLIFVIF